MDGDGKIDYQEFLVLLREKTRTIFISKWLNKNIYILAYINSKMYA